MNPTRRQVLRGLAGAALAPGLLSSTAVRSNAQQVDPSPIIDTHQHLWDPEQFRILWMADAPAILRRKYGPKEYAEATAGLNIQSIYMEVDVDPTQHPLEAEYVIGLCRDKVGATRAAVIGARPAAPEFAEYIKRFAASGLVRGVRQLLQPMPRGACLRDDFVGGIRLLGSLGLCFDLCMRPTELADGVKLSELAPDTRFVLDHCGNADPAAFVPRAYDRKPSHDADAWKRDIDALAKRPNVLCKISGIVGGAPEKWTPEHLAPIVNHCLDAFGPDKVLFGGDWPVCLKRAPLRQWIDALETIVAPRPVDERRKLWAENARKFYMV